MKRQYFKVSIFILLYFSFSCKSDIKEPNSLIIDKKSYSIIIDTSLIIGINDKIYQSNYLNDNSLIINCREDKKIIYINLDKLNYRILKDKIEGVYSLFSLNKDSLFVVKDLLNQVELLNNCGVVVKVYDLNEKIIDRNQICYLYSIENDLIFKNGYLYLGVYTNENPNELSTFSKMNTLCKLNIINNEYVIFSKWPRYFIGDSDYYLICPSFAINDEDDIVVSFPKYKNVFYYKNNNLELSKEIQLISKYDSNVFKPYGKKFENKLKLYFKNPKEYFIEEPMYSKIYYDRFNSFYYRVFVHRFHMYNDDGTINDYNKKPFSIVIYNSDFEYLGEKLFNGSEYSFNSIVINKKGFILRKYSNNENEILFEEFEVNKFK